MEYDHLRRDYSRKRHQKNDQRKLRYHHGQSDKKNLRSSQTNSKGHVATYGQVAAMAGNPKMSRAVGNALHKNPDPENIPCFRVVNAKGELAEAFAFGGEGKQAKLLEEDGVVVVDGKVDLDVYGM